MANLANCNRGALAHPNNAPGLMTHVVLGYPSLRESIDLVKLMADEGVCGIELQIPFSDPIADGPTIMEANELALGNGVKMQDCLQSLSTLAASVSIPLYIMTYANRAFQFREGRKRGVHYFLREIMKRGARGAIIPDLPIDELSADVLELVRDFGVQLVPVVAPTSSPKRLRSIALNLPSSFVYCMSTTGTTGARKVLPPDLESYVVSVQKIFSRPAAVGFGISTSKQVSVVRSFADIAIVGSQLIRLIQTTPRSQRLSKARKFLRPLILAAG